MEDNIIKGAWVLLFLGVTAVSGELCPYSGSYSLPETMECSTGCCGDYFNRYCCYTDIGVIVGAVFGSIVFVVSIIVVICCCIRSRGSGGLILQPATTTTTVIGIQTTAVGYGYDQPGDRQSGYGHVGYPNTGFPGQMPTNNVQQGAEQKREAPPPPYQPTNPM